jgi:iron-sulfur cluster assembly protein
MSEGLISMTDAAADRVRDMIAGRGKDTFGVRIGVSTAGCSGLTYTLEFADQRDEFDELVEYKGVNLVIDPKAIMFVAGTQMDYVEEKLKSGFVFTNPNEQGRCGCGESFHV